MKADFHRKGIISAHNADEFFNAVKQNNVKVSSQAQSEVEGITHVKYQILAKNREGNITKIL